MFIVVMCGGEPYSPNYRQFFCHGKVWEQILEMAKEWGWKPLGTKPVSHWGDEYWKDQGFPSDYHCEDFGKIVTTEDGKSLADALERALATSLKFSAIDGPVLIVEGMNAQEYRLANAPLSADLLKAFIRFLHRGDFKFFWDD